PVALVAVGGFGLRQFQLPLLLFSPRAQGSHCLHRLDWPAPFHCVRARRFSSGTSPCYFWQPWPVATLFPCHGHSDRCAAHHTAGSEPCAPATGHRLAPPPFPVPPRG